MLPTKRPKMDPGWSGSFSEGMAMIPPSPGLSSNPSGGLPPPGPRPPPGPPPEAAAPSGISGPRPPPKPPAGGPKPPPGSPPSDMLGKGPKRPNLLGSTSMQSTGMEMPGSMGMNFMGMPPMGMGMGLGMMGGMMGPMGMMGPGMMGMGHDMMPGGMGPLGMPPGDMLGVGFGTGMPGSGPMNFDGPGMGGRGRGAAGGRGGGRFGGRGSLATGPLRGDANDYCQHFVDTGQRPQNFLRDSQLTDRYQEYPKMKELIARKDELVASRAHPPYYLKADLKQLPLSVETFGTKFDVVLIDPPWDEYGRRAPGASDYQSWPWQEIMALEIEKITDPPSFVFLWCGSAEGLDAGRHCLKKWGFRRCEDICWVKTNQDPSRKASTVRQDANAVLQHTKEHCLMGIKGMVRRSTDGHLIHANVDTDIIVSEEPPSGSMVKPEEMYHLIEHFSLGKRRLELFGEDHNVRPGWVTVGNSLSASNFIAETYASHFRNPDGSVFISSFTRPQPGQPNLLGTTEEIETLRPRTPPPGAPPQ